jgi:LCP family protein required for cell wall assembly
MQFQDEPHRQSLGGKLPDWAVYLLLAVFVIGVVLIGYFTFTGVKDLVANSAFSIGPNPTPEFAAMDDPAQAVAVGEEVQVTLEGRVTVLLMGIDERESEQGPWRTDTMIVLTLDPETQTIGMLSIPRDLWVEIPDYDLFDRINKAHFRGDADQYPGGGGPALAMKTVQQNLGVPVNYYLSINFNAFVKTIDQIGCIPISVPQTIDDPTYPDGAYGYDPFYIEAGEHCMEGETLLKYARTRATFGSDFDRALRQQQVIHAVRSHVLSTGQLPTLIAQAPELYEIVQDGINTNLSLPQMIEIARVVAEIPDENICSAVVDNYYVSLLTLDDGSQVLVPDRNAVRGLVEDIFTGTGECTPGGPNLASEAAAEQATVGILNGTQTEGLATQTGDFLTGQGINVVELANAERNDYAETIIYNYNGKVSTARYLASLLNIPESAIVVTDNPSALTDIQVILGSDYRP